MTATFDSFGKFTSKNVLLPLFSHKSIHKDEYSEYVFHQSPHAEASDVNYYKTDMDVSGEQSKIKKFDYKPKTFKVFSTYDLYFFSIV